MIKYVNLGKTGLKVSRVTLGTMTYGSRKLREWVLEIEETLEALHDIVKAGKVRYLGISSVYAWQFAKALYTADIHGWTRFVSIQNHYNLVYREEEREVIPLALDQGIGIIPWSPLARGFLAGNRSKSDHGQTLRAKTDEFAHNLYYQDSDFKVVDRVVELAAKRGVKPTQIALAWLLHQPGVTSPIIGASKIEHLKEAVEAVDLELSDEERKFLEEPYTPHPILGIGVKLMQKPKCQATWRRCVGVADEQLSQDP